MDFQGTAVLRSKGCTISKMADDFRHKLSDPGGGVRIGMEQMLRNWVGRRIEEFLMRGGDSD